MDAVSNNSYQFLNALTNVTPLQSQSAQRIVEADTISPKEAREAESSPFNVSAQKQEQLPTEPSQRVYVPANATAQEGSATSADAEDANSQNQQQVEQVLAQLKARDTEVRAHEQAHLSAAGPYSTGGMSFSYQTGPDGKRYAIGGEVGIDISPVANDPEATLRKAQVVQAAALAPAEPSTQDMRVASQASQMMVEAQAQIQQQNMEEANGASKEAQGEEGSESDQDGMEVQSANQIQAREASESRPDNDADDMNTVNGLDLSAVSTNNPLSMSADRMQFESRLMTMAGSY